MLGSFLIIAGLIWLLRQYTLPPPPDAKRVDERRKALADVKIAAKELETYGYIDSGKGLVRLPVVENDGMRQKLSRAAELIIQEWENPAAGRSNLLARWSRFNPPPPKPVEQKSPFE